MAPEKTPKGISDMPEEEGNPLSRFFFFAVFPGVFFKNNWPADKIF